MSSTHTEILSCPLPEVVQDGDLVTLPVGTPILSAQIECTDGNGDQHVVSAPKFNLDCVVVGTLIKVDESTNCMIPITERWAALERDPVIGSTIRSARCSLDDSRIHRNRRVHEYLAAVQLVSCNGGSQFLREFFRSNTRGHPSPTLPDRIVLHIASGNDAML